MGNLQPMFEDFKKLTGVKKIMSFGGWSFSTEADTAPIFRQGVSWLLLLMEQKLMLFVTFRSLLRNGQHSPTTSCSLRMTTILTGLILIGNIQVRGHLK
jgi:hypothetical protein